jgi:hypothetical protein
MERLAKNKYSSLFGPFISYKENGPFSWSDTLCLSGKACKEQTLTGLFVSYKEGGPNKLVLYITLG